MISVIEAQFKSSDMNGPPPSTSPYGKPQQTDDGKGRKRSGIGDPVQEHKRCKKQKLSPQEQNSSVKHIIDESNFEEKVNEESRCDNKFQASHSEVVSFKQKEGKSNVEVTEENTSKSKTGRSKKKRGAHRMSRDIHVQRLVDRGFLTHPSEQQKECGPYVCSICGNVYSERSTLKQHVSNYHFGKYACKPCGQTFSGSSSLAKHLRSNKHKRTIGEKTKLHLQKTHEPKIECSYCGKMLTGSAMRKHVKYTHLKTKLMCQYCGVMIRGENLLIKNHEDLCLKKKAAFVKQLPAKKTDTKKKRMKKTKKKGKGEENCDNSNFCTLQQETVEANNERANTDKHVLFRAAYMCKACSMKFELKSNYDKHIQTCTMRAESSNEEIDQGEIDIRKFEAQVISCSECQSTFHYSAELYKHYYNAHCFVSCKECGYSQFPDEETLQMHLKLECPGMFGGKMEISSRQGSDELDETEEGVKGNAENKCPDCEVTFVSAASLEEHKKLVMESEAEYPQRCMKCFQNKIPRMYSRFRSVCHVLQHKKQFRYVCFLCGWHVDTIKQITEHMYKYHISEYRENISSCSSCHQFFPSGILEAHVAYSKKVTEKLECKCFLCGQEFDTPELLDKHSEEFNLYCQECGTHFMRQVELDNHIAVVHDMSCDSYNTDNLCLHCDVNFPDLAQLKKHVKSVQQPAKEPVLKYYCKHCHTSFAKASELSSHVKSVLESSCKLVCSWENDFNLCLRCGVSFKSKEAYQYHLRKMFLKCYVCHEHTSLVDKIQFSIHIETHEKNDTNLRLDTAVNNSSLLKCKFCREHFISYRQLSYHENAATKLDQSKLCEFCGMNLEWVCQKTFHSRKHGWERRHLLKSGETPCTYCESWYPSKEAYLKHEECMKLTGAGIKCKDCGDLMKMACQKAFHAKRHSEGMMVIPARQSETTSPGFMTCRYCYQQFSSVKLLNFHIIHIFVLKKCKKCWICGERLQSHCHQQMHRDNHSRKILADSKLKHGEDTGKFRCAYCQKTFFTLVSLEIHNKKITFDLNEVCSVCEVTIETSCQKSMHENKHKKIGEICPRCEGKIKNDNRYDHVQKLTDVYVCLCCGEKVQFSCQKIAHETCFPYVCKLCNIHFDTKAAWADHDRSWHHTNEGNNSKKSHISGCKGESCVSTSQPEQTSLKTTTERRSDVTRTGVDLVIGSEPSRNPSDTGIKQESNFMDSDASTVSAEEVDALNETKHETNHSHPKNIPINRSETIIDLDTPEADDMYSQGLPESYQEQSDESCTREGIGVNENTNTHTASQEQSEESCTREEIGVGNNAKTNTASENELRVIGQNRDKDNKYMCNYCHSDFDFLGGRKGLKTHESCNKYKQSKWFQHGLVLRCVTCKMPFETKCQKALHDRLVCFICNKHFQHFMDHSLHLKQCKEKKLGKSKKSLVSEKLLKIGNTAKNCYLCLSKFKNNLKLKQHIREGMNEMYQIEGMCTKCNGCRDVFKIDCKINAHFERRYLHKCNDCKMHFDSESRLVNHQKRCFFCQICKTSLKGSKLFGQHRKKVHELPWEKLSDYPKAQKRAAFLMKKAKKKLKARQGKVRASSSPSVQHLDTKPLSINEVPDTHAKGGTLPSYMTVGKAASEAQQRQASASSSSVQHVTNPPSINAKVGTLPSYLMTLGKAASKAQQSDVSASSSVQHFVTNPPFINEVPDTCAKAGGTVASCHMTLGETALTAQQGKVSASSNPPSINKVPNTHAKAETVSFCMRILGKTTVKMQQCQLSASSSSPTHLVRNPPSINEVPDTPAKAGTIPSYSMTLGKTASKAQQSQVSASSSSSAQHLFRNMPCINKVSDTHAKAGTVPSYLMTLGKTASEAQQSQVSASSSSSAQHLFRNMPSINKVSDTHAKAGIIASCFKTLEETALKVQQGQVSASSSAQHLLTHSPSINVVPVTHAKIGTVSSMMTLGETALKVQQGQVSTSSSTQHCVTNPPFACINKVQDTHAKAGSIASCMMTRGKTASEAQQGQVSASSSVQHIVTYPSFINGLPVMRAKAGSIASCMMTLGNTAFEAQKGQMSANSSVQHLISHSPSIDKVPVANAGTIKASCKLTLGKTASEAKERIKPIISVSSCEGSFDTLKLKKYLPTVILEQPVGYVAFFVNMNVPGNTEDYFVAVRMAPSGAAPSQKNAETKNKLVFQFHRELRLVKVIKANDVRNCLSHVIHLVKKDNPV